MKDSQKVFFKEITQKSKNSKNLKAIHLYEDLVLHRYKEVISNAFPILFSKIPKNKFEKIVKVYIAKGAKSEFIWQMPLEFRTFLTKNYAKMFPYLDDLLWFEWIEIELLMKNYTNFKVSKFDWKKRYTLHVNSDIKELEYKVHLREFKNKNRCILLAYYSIKDKTVLYREISAFMFEFLKLITKYSLKEAYLKMCKHYDLDEIKSKNMIKDAISELITLGVLRSIDK